MKKIKVKNVWKQRTNSIDMNELSYRVYYNRMYGIACSVFEWIGLPSTVNTIMLEEYLLTRGMCCLYYDEIVEEWHVLPFTYRDGFDIQGYPIIRNVFSRFTDFHRKVDSTNSFVIFDNKSRTNETMDIVEYYANRIWDYDRTIDINASTQKTPALICGDRRASLTIRNAYQQWQGNMPAITVGKKFDVNAIKAIKTDVPFIGLEMDELRASIWNEFLTSVGVPNINVRKKERMVSDEVKRISGGAVASRYPRLEPREFACTQINASELWKATVGENVSVYYRDEKSEESEEEGGELNVHDDISNDS